MLRWCLWLDCILTVCKSTDMKAFVTNPIKRQKKRTWNTTPIQTCEAMGRGCGHHSSQGPVPKVGNFHLLSNMVHDLCILALNSPSITCAISLSWKSKIHPLSVRSVAAFGSNGVKCNHRTTKYSELEGTPVDHQVQLLALHRTPQESHLVPNISRSACQLSESISQGSDSSYWAYTADTGFWMASDCWYLLLPRVTAPQAFTNLSPSVCIQWYWDKVFSPIMSHPNTKCCSTPT